MAGAWGTGHKGTLLARQCFDSLNTVLSPKFLLSRQKTPRPGCLNHLDCGFAPAAPLPPARPDMSGHVHCCLEPERPPGSGTAGLQPVGAERRESVGAVGLRHFRNSPPSPTVPFPTPWSFTSWRGFGDPFTLLGTRGQHPPSWSFHFFICEMGHWFQAWVVLGVISEVPPLQAPSWLSCPATCCGGIGNLGQERPL